MIPLPFLLGNWRTIAMVAGFAALGIALGVARLQLASCRAETAEFRRAYDLLAQSTQRQSDSIRAAEKKAAEAAKIGARARADAAGAVQVATRSADALARVMAAPRPGGECPQAQAVGAVRADLAGK